MRQTLARPLPATCRGPKLITRREMLQLGGSSFLGLSLAELLRADERSATRHRNRASAGTVGGQPVLSPTADGCILIFLDGGPSHLDMWDMKPGAPAEIRGEFKPISSSLPGVQISEHLPGFSRQVHRGTLIRSAITV